MTFEEFENTLQDWLDEGRLDEVSSLIPQVCEADRAQCEELLFTYRALFSGLAASPAFAHSPSLPVQSSPITEESTWTTASLSGLALTLALCLTMVALAPGLLRFGPESTAVPSGNALANVSSDIEFNVSNEVLGPETQLEARDQDFTRRAALSFEPFARSMAFQTDSALRSLNQVTSSLNPMDSHLAAYREAAPLIDTLARGLMPGTHSLSNAFSVLQESTASPPTPSTTPSADSTSEVATESVS